MEEQKDFYEEFKEIWDKLSDENKEHIKNGLGDNLIQTEEQARTITAIMKFMLVFQMMEGDKNENDNWNWINIKSIR